MTFKERLTSRLALLFRGEVELENGRCVRRCFADQVIVLCVAAFCFKILIVLDGVAERVLSGLAIVAGCMLIYVLLPAIEWKEAYCTMSGQSVTLLVVGVMVMGFLGTFFWDFVLG